MNAEVFMFHLGSCDESLQSADQVDIVEQMCQT